MEAARLDFIGNAKAILGAGAGGLAILSVAGVIPPVGFVRVFTFGLRSYFFHSYPLSVRKSEILQLTKSILHMERGSYITVMGGKGNGKSCLIDTALNRHFGVVKLTTESGASKSAIIDEALRRIIGVETFVNPESSARRLLFLYSLVFSLSPIVVIKVPERQEGDKYADVTSAVRALTDDYGLRVIVNGLPNSIPPELLTTKRETIIAVEPMSRAEIESIPEFKGLIDLLKAHHLDDPVWKVLGGSPVDYLKLKAVLQVKSFLSHTNTDADVNTDADSIVDKVKNHIQSVLSYALNKDIAESSANTKAIIKLFREKKTIKIPKAELVAMGFIVDYPNKVFREVKSLDDWFVEPSTSAVSLIISENIQRDDGVQELQERLFNEAKGVRKLSKIC